MCSFDFKTVFLYLKSIWFQNRFFVSKNDTYRTRGAPISWKILFVPWNHHIKSTLKMSFSMKTKGAAIIQVRPLLARVQYFSKYLYIFILVKEQ